MAAGFAQATANAQQTKPAPKAPASPADTFAELYEHLAASIIEIRATEDNLVKGLLTFYHGSAQRHLNQAATAEGETKSHLEAAAADVANIANEGDKRVRAVRQRLSEAGHYHQEDSETKEDYMFINSQEKKALLAIAERIGRMGEDAADEEIRKTSQELRTLFTKAIGRE
jgi:hypothetical protein